MKERRGPSPVWHQRLERAAAARPSSIHRSWRLDFFSRELVLFSSVVVVAFFSSPSQDFLRLLRDGERIDPVRSLGVSSLDFPPSFTLVKKEKCAGHARICDPRLSAFSPLQLTDSWCWW